MRRPQNVFNKAIPRPAPRHVSNQFTRTLPPFGRCLIGFNNFYRCLASARRYLSGQGRRYKRGLGSRGPRRSRRRRRRAEVPPKLSLTSLLPLRELPLGLDLEWSFHPGPPPPPATPLARRPARQRARCRPGRRRDRRPSRLALLPRLGRVDDQRPCTPPSAALPGRGTRGVGGTEGAQRLGRRAGGQRAALALGSRDGAPCPRGLRSTRGAQGTGASHGEGQEAQG